MSLRASSHDLSGHMFTTRSYGFFFTENRGPGKAAAYQAASLGLTLLIAIVSGLITGVIVKKFATEKVNSRLFEDDVNFTIEEEEAAADYKKPAADGYKKPITINEVDYNLGGNKY